MEHEIEFYESAFRHGINEGDIRHAITHKMHDGALPEYPDADGLVGFDRAGRLLEICYYEDDDGTFRVFHAMNCRESFLAKLV